MLNDRLAAVPEVDVPETTAITEGIEHSVRYLASPEALASIAADTYWPKWDSPWWHMLLLHELGLAHRIPDAVVRAMIAGVDALPLHEVPIDPATAPADYDPMRDVSCHCALGCLAPMLAACGADVPVALPWIEPWLVRYQMADGGLNCDDAAYRVRDEIPSSMVGTVAPIEAMLGYPASPGRDAFLARGAEFLVGRELRQGSTTRHNAEERAAAPAWLQLAFPRFYFYDVLRGLAALVRCPAPIDVAAITPVVEHLLTEFPDGVVRVRRRAYLGHETLSRVAGAWTRTPTTAFPLLDATSVIGEPSRALTRQWTATRRALLGRL